MFEADTMADTANSLKCWAEGELGYCGTVSVEDLSKICLGTINNVWSWIVSHCRDRERIKTIHGNLILMKKKVEGKVFHSSCGFVNVTFRRAWWCLF